MMEESIKQFLKPDWRKESVFGAFLVLGWICFLGILDVSNMTEIFFLLPFAIILEIFSQILEPYTFLAGMIFSLIYWYVFSCLLIFLFDILIKIYKERFSAKDTRTKDFPKPKLNKGINKGISALIGILVVVLAAIICCSLVVYQYLTMEKEQKQQPVLNSVAESEIVDGRIVGIESQLSGNADSKIVFYDSGEKEINDNQINEIGDEEILRKLTETLGLSFSLLKEVRLCEYAIERPLGVFYFFAANGMECGKNCGWILYKYESEKLTLSHIGIPEEEKKEYDSNFFGGNVSGYCFSPDKSKAIVSAVGSGGFCYLGEDIGIIDFEQSNFRRIKGFNDYKYGIHEIESLDWIGNDSLKFSLLERNCGKDEKMKRVRQYKYYFSQDKLELVKEEFQELDERERNRF